MNVTPLQKKTAQAIVNIFETGSLHGDYGAVAVIPGDKGHLSYGRSQASLASGNLEKLIRAYVFAEGAQRHLANSLGIRLPLLTARDMALDDSNDFKDLLKQAGSDPVMRKVQDDFFDREYWDRVGPLCDARQIQSALGAAVIYDSLIQGSLVHVAARMHQPGVTGNAWVVHYVSTRRLWLLEKGGVLAKTVYRMDAFSDLIGLVNWDLDLPITIRGHTISIDNLG